MGWHLKGPSHVSQHGGSHLLGANWYRVFSNHVDPHVVNIILWNMATNCFPEIYLPTLTQKFSWMIKSTLAWGKSWYPPMGEPCLSQYPQRWTGNRPMINKHIQAETRWPPFFRFSNGFSWMKLYEFWLKFHWSLFLAVQLTIFQHWFRKWLGAGQATSHYLNQLYASLGLNELRLLKSFLTPNQVLNHITWSNSVFEIP